MRATVIAFLLTAGMAGASDWRHCPGSGWAVAGAGEQEQALVCLGIAAAEALFSQCGLPTATATRVKVVDELPLYCGIRVPGLYDAAADMIRLGNPAACVAEAEESGLFSLLPAELAFSAVAAHEAAHAMLFAAGLTEEHRLEHEYIASVVQMQSLPEEARDGLLARQPQQAQVSVFELNAVIYATRPDVFSALAWTHFTQQPDGCAFIRALMEGRERLPALPGF